MQQVPPRPGMSTGAKVAVIAGVVASVLLCGGAALAIGSLAVAARNEPASVDTNTPTAQKPTPSPLPDRYQPIAAPCSPLEAVPTTPPLTDVRPTPPADRVSFTAEGCDAESAKGEVFVTVRMSVNHGDEIMSGADRAEYSYSGTYKYYRKQGGSKDLPGLGDRAIVAPPLGANSRIRVVAVLAGNVELTVEVAVGEDRAASAALAERVARTYVEALGP